MQNPSRAIISLGSNLGDRKAILDGAIESIRTSVGPDTAILPMLNGMKHLDVLSTQFGADRVLGGQCVAAVTLDAEGTVVHLNKLHSMTFGELKGGLSPRIEAFAAQCEGAHFDANPSATVLQAMWEKWVFLATLAGGTCLMRAPVGDIIAAPGGQDFLLGLFDEASSIAAAHGFAPSDNAKSRAHAMYTEAGSPITASMLRDLENGARIEADHVIGDLIARGAEKHTPAPLFSTAYTQLKAYESRRARTEAKT